VNVTTTCKAPDTEVQQRQQKISSSKVPIFFYLINYFLVKTTQIQYRTELRCRFFPASRSERTLCLKSRFHNNTLKACTTSKTKQYLTLQTQAHLPVQLREDDDRITATITSRGNSEIGVRFTSRWQPAEHQLRPGVPGCAATFPSSSRPRTAPAPSFCNPETVKPSSQPSSPWGGRLGSVSSRAAFLPLGFVSSALGTKRCSSQDAQFQLAKTNKRE